MISHLVVGSINWDVLIFLKKFPGIGEEIAANYIFESPGGKGGNISICSGKILGREKVGLFSIVGNDSTGQKQIGMLKKKGIATDYIIKSNATESGKAYVIIDDYGRNLIITKKNTDNTIYNILNKTLDDKLIKTITNLNAMTITDLPIESIEKLLSFKCTRKRIVTWIPGIKSNIKLIKVEKILKKISYLIINESESFQLTGSPYPSDACNKISNLSKEVGVIITLGENGCMYSKNGQINKIPTVNLAEIGLNIVNTAGSGDVFAGTFSSLKVLDYDDMDAIKMALVAGSIKATKKEIQAGPSLNQILQFVKKYKVEIKTKP